MFWNWLLHVLGVRPLQPSFWYNWWSGAGSDFGELAIVAGLVSIYRKHNCSTRWCWRVGRYPVLGTPFTTCKKHHPVINKAPTAGELSRNR